MGNKIELDGFLRWLFLAVVGLVCAFLFLVLAWAVNKGFELSDESYYCISTANPQNNSLLNSYFGLITSRLCPGIADVRGLRICHLVYQLAASIFFAVSFLRLISTWYPFGLSTRVFIVFTLLIASGLNYDYLPMTLSYNSWSLILSLVFFACSLQSILVDSKTRVAYYVVMGFCAALLFYNKMPNGIAVAGIFSIQLLLFRRNRFWVWLLAGLGGALFGALFLFGSFDLFITKTTALFQNLRAISGSAMGTYAQHFYEFVFIYPGRKLMLTEVILLAGLWVGSRRNAPIRILYITTALNLLLAFFYTKGNSQNVSNDFVILFIVFCSVLGAVIFLRRYLVLTREAVFFTVSYFLLPFLLAFGTSNVIFYTASQLGIFSVVSILVLVIVLREAGGEFILPMVCVGLSLACLPVICNGVILNPYRQEALHKKNMPLVFSENEERVLESPERFLMLVDLTERLKLWNVEKRPVLASPPVMGAIVLAGMRPAEVYWWGDDERFANVNEYYFSKWKPQENPFLIISQDIKDSGVQKEYLKNSGIDLDNAYVVCDSVFMKLNNKYFYFCKPL